MSSSDTTTIELEDRGITLTKTINPTALSGALRVDFTIASAVEEPVELSFTEILPDEHKNANIGYDSEYEQDWDHDPEHKQYLNFDLILDPAQTLETFYAVPTFDSDTDTIEVFENPPEITTIDHNPQPNTTPEQTNPTAEPDNDVKQVTLEDTPSTDTPAESTTEEPETTDSTDSSDTEEPSTPFDAPEPTDTPPETDSTPTAKQDTDVEPDPTPDTIPPATPDASSDDSRALEVRVEQLEQQQQELQAYTTALEELLNETGTVTDLKQSIDTLNTRITALENTLTEPDEHLDSDELAELREEIEDLNAWRDAMTSAVNPSD